MTDAELSELLRKKRYGRALRSRIRAEAIARSVPPEKEFDRIRKRQYRLMFFSLDDSSPRTGQAGPASRYYHYITVGLDWVRANCDDLITRACAAEAFGALTGEKPDVLVKNQ